MNHTIWKFHIDRQKGYLHQVLMPEGAQVLTAQLQYGTELMLWALVDADRPNETRTFRLYGSGHDISPDVAAKAKYISTVQMLGGGLVLHVFEI